jgi:hypothetical protein
LDLLREMGLTAEEIDSLVFANKNAIPKSETAGSLGVEDTARFKLVGGLMAESLRVYGPENALDWLRQPIERFNRESPLEFLNATRNFGEIDAYLVEASESYFF